MENLCARIVANDVKLNLTVDVGWKNLENEGAKRVCEALVHNTVVHSLWMGTNGITDGTSISALLRSNSTLTWLDLRANPLGAAGIAPIAQSLQQIDSLRRLWLAGTNLQDEGAKMLAAALARCNSLTVIDLASNKIMDSGICALSSALRRNFSLRKLWLYDNKCTDVGAQAVADMLRMNRSLILVDLSGNGITEVGRRFVLDALEHNRVLTTLYCEFSRDMEQRVGSLLERNNSETQLRKSRCQDALVVFLGVRKLHRFESGMWAVHPREILRMIARLVWHLRDHE